MGQDSESAAEFVMTVRTDHVAMKTWYSNSSSDNTAIQRLKEKYGEYPSLWKEVLNWTGWKETRKEYLKYMQTSGKDTKQGLNNNGAPGDSNNLNDNSEGNGSSGEPRKRKSRWGTTAPDNNNSGITAAAGNDGDAANKRRSRWGRDENQQQQQPTMNSNIPRPPITLLQQPGGGGLSSLLPGILPGVIEAQQLAPQQQEEMKELQGRLRVINEKMDNLDAEAERIDALPRSDPQRSPSPPPIYGPDGKRKNTRAVRWRERYTTERQDILEKLLQLNPNTRKSSNIFFRKRSQKIRIPVEKHPTYNFIGLIIGPRGKTQKELEAKTGCKIAIRGRGSVKEGARGRRDGQVMQGDTDPLHVVITGDDQASVDAAASMIEQMLIVIDDEKNVHKQQQLRELALLNGTLKDEEIFCSICAERGHRSFECPKQFSAGGVGRNKGLQVKCAICGDTSHPTRDCRQKPIQPIGGAAASSQPKENEEMDSDYLSFMAEIEGKKVENNKSGVGGDGSSAAAVPPSSSLPPPPHTSLPPPPPTGGILPPSGAPPLLPPPPPPSSLHHVGLPPPPSSRGFPPPPNQLPPPPADGVHPPSLPPMPPSLTPVLPPIPPPGVGQQYTPNNNYYSNQQHGGIPPPFPNNGNIGSNNNSGGYHQQQQYQRPHNEVGGGGYVGGGYQQQHQQTGQYQFQQQPNQQQQQQQQQFQQQVRPGEETTAWDPNAYYGNGGAGELNWWEQ